MNLNRFKWFSPYLFDTVFEYPSLLFTFVTFFPKKRDPIWSPSDQAFGLFSISGFGSCLAQGTHKPLRYFQRPGNGAAHHHRPHAHLKGLHYLFRIPETAFAITGTPSFIPSKSSKSGSVPKSLGGNQRWKQSHQPQFPPRPGIFQSRGQPSREPQALPESWDQLLQGLTKGLSGTSTAIISAPASTSSWARLKVGVMAIFLPHWSPFDADHWQIGDL